MHRSVRLMNIKYCKLDWSFLWSISAARKFSIINKFCREWTLGTESTQKHLTVYERSTTKVGGKITDPQWYVRSVIKSRLKVMEKAANIWRLEGLRRQSCGREVAVEQLWKVGNPHPATSMWKACWGRKFAMEKLWKVGRHHASHNLHAKILLQK